MKLISKALLLCSIVCAVLFLTACTKNNAKDEPQPVCPAPLTIAGTWELDALLPFLDSSRQWFTPIDEDKIFYTFREDGTFSMERPAMDFRQEGTYKFEYVTAGDSSYQTGHKLILTSPDVVSEFKVELLTADTFRLDWWYLWCATGYSSSRYKRLITSSAN